MPPHVDEHWRGVLAQTRSRWPLSGLVIAGVLAALVPAGWTGQSKAATFALLGGLVGLHALLLVTWRPGHGRVAAWLEPALPLVTPALLAVFIIAGLQPYPLAWVLIYLYVPIVAAVWPRSRWGVAAFVFPGALILAVELVVRVSDSPLPTMVANVLLPPTLYLVLSAEEERLRRLRAQAETLQKQALKADSDARRVALAREVHDGLGAHLCAIATHAAVASMAASSDRERASSSATRLKARAESAVAELEALLNPTPTLSWRQCAERLERVVEALTTPALPMTFTVIPPVDAAPSAVEGALTHALERIAREALANALRHAAATRVRLVLEHRGDSLRLMVEDDGQGLGGGHEGFGTASIRARAESVGGHARWQSGHTSDDRGTKLVVVAPLEATP